MDFVPSLPDEGLEGPGEGWGGRRHSLVFSASGSVAGYSCSSELQSLLKLSSKSEY